MTPSGRRVAETWNLVLGLSAAVLLFLVMGESRVMRALFLKEMLSLAPLVALMLGDRRSFRAGLSWLACALALFLVGDAVAALALARHPTVGSISLMGQTIWLGWLMFPVLLWSGVRSLLIPGEWNTERISLSITLAAGGLGVLGIALGGWWADAAGAGLIGLGAAREGLRQLRGAAPRRRFT